MSPERVRMRRTGPPRRELRAIYIGRERMAPMLSLSAYFDESRNFDGEGILAVAGYVGERRMWDEVFTPAWRKVLSESPRPIGEFKASDCRQGTGEFNGWPKADRDALTRDLVDVLCDPAMALTGFGAAMLMQESKFTSPVRQQNRRHFAYWWGCQSVTADAVDVSLQALKADELQCVYDEERDLLRPLRDVVNRIRDASPEVRERVREPFSGRSHEIPPLQAADLLAYETYKELKNRREDRAPSRALVRLVDSKVHFGYWVPLPFVLTCLGLANEGIDIPPSRGHKLYDSTTAEKVCRERPSGAWRDAIALAQR